MKKVSVCASTFTCATSSHRSQST